MAPIIDLHRLSGWNLVIVRESDMVPVVDFPILAVKPEKDA
jgi:hypothetical protein